MLPALHLRIDSIEAVLQASPPWKGPVDDAGYRVAYAIAEDNLRVGLQVIADSVNPIAQTRRAWTAIAERWSSGDSGGSRMPRYFGTPAAR